QQEDKGRADRTRSGTFAWHEHDFTDAVRERRRSVQWRKRARVECHSARPSRRTTRCEPFRLDTEASAQPARAWHRADHLRSPASRPGTFAWVLLGEADPVLQRRKS